jgi:AcrR family transcriptional regulator
MFYLGNYCRNMRIVQVCPMGTTPYHRRMDGAPGLRERKKLATKRALHEAALRLAMRHGLDHLTVEAIADAANVSRRTFSNYFANKEEALLYGDRAKMRTMLDTVRARPATESPWTALTASARELFQALDLGHDPEWVARTRFIRSHPALLAQQVATHSSLERELANALLERMSTEQRSATTARILAACFLTAVRVATQSWLDQPAGTPLAAITARVLAETAGRFD